jgi:hypothetical protein
VNIYTAGLLEPLKTDIELHNPQDMEMAMSLARAYERHAVVVADTNKSVAPKWLNRPLPLKAPVPSSPSPTALTLAPLTTTPRRFKRLTVEEMSECRCS